MRAVDCQAFAGAFALGAVQAGFELAGKCEVNMLTRGTRGFGVANLEANRALLGDKWEAQVSAAEDWQPVDDVDYLLSNPPCSGFSRLTRPYGVLEDTVYHGPDAPYNSCMWDTMKYAARLGGPQFVVMESVQAAYTEGRDLMMSLRGFLEAELGGRYDATHVLMSNPTLGNPQMRDRYFLVLSRDGEPFGIESPRPREVPTYYGALADLMGLEDTWDPQPYVYGTASGWAESLRSPAGAVDSHKHGVFHGTRACSVVRLRDLWQFMTPGKQFCKDEPARDAYRDMFGEEPKTAWGEARSIRAKYDGRVRTVTGSGAGQVMHWAEPRSLTVRESARLMGYPDDWTWLAARKPDPDATSPGYMWTGKQVTVDAGRWISGWVRCAIDGRAGAFAGEEIGDRERLIDVTDDYRAWPENDRLAWKDKRRMADLAEAVAARPA